MSKYYVIGYSEQEIKFGKGIEVLKIGDKLRNNSEIFKISANSVLIYNTDNRDFRDKAEYKEYFCIDYIRDTIMPYIQDQIELNVLNIIDESELPDKKSIILKYI